MRMALYKLVTPLIAIPLDDNDGRLFLEVQRDTVITTAGGPDASGLVHFNHAGQWFATFAQDLEARAELVKAANHAL
jgi:hypothetical protein